MEPVQVFGFSYKNRKNAADIQLVIDVIDIIFQQPTLDTFVIVSGDGDFGSLAKKLRQYGKTVIGCAYEDAAGKSFQAICDAFVHVPDPILKRHVAPRSPRKTQSEPPLPAQPLAERALPLDPDNQRLCTDLAPNPTQEAEGAIEQTKLPLNPVETALVNCRQAGILVPAPDGGDRYFVAASITNVAQCLDHLQQWLKRFLQPHLEQVQERPKPELLQKLLCP